MRRYLLLLLLWLTAFAQVQAEEAPLQVVGARTVDALEAKRLYDYGVLFVDVRAAREWSWGHVYGAVHLDLADRFSSLAMTHLPRNVPLVLYCDSEVCSSAAAAAQLAVSWGYRQVFYFRSGYFAWQLFDFPLGKGAAGEVLAFSEPGH
ncbi:rhodanese-like domain-containing protein [Pseudomonas cavernicola]|uniref:Rhodanese-like domain-containing protein n=1 Tax=Pseudomonas cavernicola TaxID=2320866 RepID=A0A418XBJ0_9PSED|nr:rhodanese-like domain-containing protein [Pseudomonas cavernicola]RJG09817.1 rhodanese-like domain-containing protein [Pseudomonas cavernicola]